MLLLKTQRRRMLNNLIKHKGEIVSILFLVALFAFTISFAILSVTTALIILLFFLEYRFNVIKIIKTIFSEKLTAILFLYVCVQFIGVFYSNNPAEAYRLAFTTLPIAFIPAFIFNTQFRPKTKRYLIEGTKIAVLSPMIILLIDYMCSSDGRSIMYFVNFSINQDKGISQFYVVFVLILPFLLSLKAITFRQNFFWNSAVLLTSLFFIFLLKNITAAMLLILSLLFLVFYSKNKRTKIIFISVISVSITLGSFALKDKIYTIWKTSDTNWETIITKNRITHTSNSLEHRIIINVLASKIIFDNTPFGIGTGGVRQELNEAYKSIGFKAGIKEKYNAHNQYLSEFLKTGVLGGILFIFSIFLLLKQISYNKHIFSITVMFFAIACLLESYLERQHGVFILSVLIPFINIFEKTS
jgi:O-antigen ligase